MIRTIAYLFPAVLTHRRRAIIKTSFTRKKFFSNKFLSFSKVVTNRIWNLFYKMELHIFKKNIDPKNVQESKKINSGKKLETLDDALSFVGDFHRYQYFLLLGLVPYIAAYGSLYFSQFFLTLTPNEHWCKINELIERNCSVDER